MKIAILIVTIFFVSSCWINIQDSEKISQTSDISTKVNIQSEKEIIKIIQSLETKIIEENILDEQATRLRAKVITHFSQTYNTDVTHKQYQNYASNAENFWHTTNKNQIKQVHIWEEGINIQTSWDSVVLGENGININSLNGDSFSIWEGWIKIISTDWSSLNMWDDGINITDERWGSLIMWEDWIKITSNDWEIFSIWESWIQINSK